MKRSLRSKVTLLTILPVSVALLITTIMGAVLLSTFGHNTTETTLSLLAQTGKNNVNYYLKSVEQSVDIVSKLVDADLDSIPDADFHADLAAHVEDTKRIFLQAAEDTNGVYTFYYRLDPEITAQTGEKGFWYVDEDGFKEHEVTDISDDRFECVWFYTPKETGKPIWLPPYVTDNLDAYVLSYNAPVYRNHKFVGVVGIEIDYKTLGEQIKDIKALKTGYAFIVENEQGTIIYHPDLDIHGMRDGKRLATPPEFAEGLLRGERHITYRFEGQEKHCYLLPLSNDMSVVVTVPTEEINDIWRSFVIQIVVAAAVIVAASIIVSVLFARRLTKPLRELTVAAGEINNGNYRVQLDYKGEDEIGTLTNTMNQLVTNLGDYIEDLNRLAYADSLTSVHNRSAFDVASKDLEDRIKLGEHVEFAVVILDCDNLKDINDAYGHDKGNVYLRQSCNLACLTFVNSPIYRIGGDEFAVILTGKDYENRDALAAQFKKKCADIAAFAKEPWERISVSLGLASFEPRIDKSFQDVFTHADHKMYADKRAKKRNKNNL